MSANRYNSIAAPTRIGSLAGVGQASTNLNSQYTFGSAGNAVAFRFVAGEASGLTDLFFYVNSITGAGGTLNVELRNAASMTLPGSTLHASTTVSVAAGSRWYQATFGSPLTLTVGEVYFIVFANAAANASTNTASIMHAGNLHELFSGNAIPFNGTTTTNGFSTGSGTSRFPPLVLKFANGRLAGSAYTVSDSQYSSQNERGLKFTPAVDVELFSVAPNFSISNLTNLKIYSGTTASGGSTVLNVTITANGISSGVIAFSPVTLSAGTSYRIVFTPTAATNQWPRYAQVQDYSRYADVQAAVVSPDIVGTEWNGSAWVDSADKLPLMQLWVRDVTAPASGGISLGKFLIAREGGQPV